MGLQTPLPPRCGGLARGQKLTCPPALSPLPCLAAPLSTVRSTSVSTCRQRCYDTQKRRKNKYNSLSKVMRRHRSSLVPYPVVTFLLIFRCYYISTLSAKASQKSSSPRQRPGERAFFCYNGVRPSATRKLTRVSYTRARAPRVLGTCPGENTINKNHNVSQHSTKLVCKPEMIHFYIIVHRIEGTSILPTPAFQCFACPQQSIILLQQQRFKWPSVSFFVRSGCIAIECYQVLFPRDGGAGNLAGTTQPDPKNCSRQAIKRACGTKRSGRRCYSNP